MSLVWIRTSALVTACSAHALAKYIPAARPSRSARWMSAYGHVPVAAVGGAYAVAVARSWPELLAFCTLALSSAVLIGIDLADHWLPDAMFLPMYPLSILLLTLAAGVSNEWLELARAVLGGAVLALGHVSITWAYPGGLGLGDVKLAGILGVRLGWFGWSHLLLGTFAAFMINAQASLALLATCKSTLTSEVPFGPAMFLGAAVGAAIGPNIFPGMA